MAMLLPSANNIAVLVASQVSGSVASFVAEMNRTARVTNTNALLGQDGFVGMKTGSHEAAGGCLMVRAVWPGAERRTP
jgi:D-alanyl-D-alanine carboxypeptidase